MPVKGGEIMSYEEKVCTNCGAKLRLTYPPPGEPGPITNYCPMCGAIIGGGAINVEVISKPPPSPECITDADCPPGYHCSFGKCVKIGIERETEDYTCPSCRISLRLVRPLPGEPAPFTRYCPVCGNILFGAGACVAVEIIPRSPPECITDANCPLGHYCSHGTCIPEEVKKRDTEEVTCAGCSAGLRLVYALPGESPIANYCPFCGTVIGGDAIDVEVLTKPAFEVAPPISWWPLAIVGGLGILVVGVAIALTAKREGERT